MNSDLSKLFFFVFAVLSIVYGSPGAALVSGTLLAITVSNPFNAQTAKMTKLLLQASVVGLGFGMNVHEVLRAGANGAGITALSIAITLAVGLALGRFFRNSFTISYLLSIGTAICGGSAIAAVSPIIGAKSEEIAAAMGTVFLLNAVALLLFPMVGHHFELTQHDFGMWSAIAIHDTSSVVGAAAKYGNDALQIAVPVKLARALWIIPIAFVTPYFFRDSRHGKAHFPHFILFFLAAAAAHSLLPQLDSAAAFLYSAAKLGLTLTLFLIGSQLSRDSLKLVGTKAIAQGVLLWIFISVGSFLILPALTR